jgi:CHAD domain-containing protein
MAESALETETKYEASGDVVLPPLDGLPQVASTRADEERLAAQYWDTADLRLLRAGITLRRRTGGHDAGWHLKLPAGPASRLEIRLPSGRSGRVVPPELADLVTARTRGAVLAPVATVRTTRQRIVLLDSAGEALAEVADDLVSARREPAPAAELSWREVEVELVAGDKRLLAAADRLLRQHGLHRSDRSAKLQRVLGTGQPPAEPAGSLTPATPAHEVVISYLAGQAEALLTMDPLVRRSRPDTVHKVRVSTRRLRSTFRAFGSVLPREATEHLSAELKWLGEVLGEARDGEVLAAHLQRQQDLTDVAQLLGPVQARIQAHFAGSRAAAAAAVLDALSSARYVALLDELDALIASPPRGPEASEPAGQVLLAAVRRSYSRTGRRLREAWPLPAGAARDAALHEARKAAKRTRYAAEVAAPVLGKRARTFVRRITKVQSLLGDQQDTVIARQLERRLGIAAHQAGENAFSYGLFYERDACMAGDYQEQALAAWQAASAPRFRRWLHGGS